MNQAFVKRILSTLPVIFGVITFTFFLIHFVPGDPIDIMLGDQATVIDKESLKKSLGLDLPIGEQYLNYLGSIFKLDLNQSLYSKVPVFDELIDKIPATFELSITSLILTLIIGIPLGVLSALFQNKAPDHFVMGFSLIGISFPSFVLAPLLIWAFALKFDILPVSDRGGLEHLILPAFSLAIPLSSVIMRVTRASVLEVAKEDYVNVARAKGLNIYQIYFKHILKNALTPVITTFGIQVGVLLTGTIITETIFDWPGLGTLLFTSINQRDYPLVQGCILFIALTYVLVNLLTDLCYIWLNPKIEEL